ncbi:GIY-YIG nuclease family protein [Arthrobacter sp. AK04]|uniref:GIY-YIG nuclease family protein n=1 Tax=Arthrobacter sp. AK04 TaxID=2900048 RepID=UPI001E48EA51|nr:GIY-YIG nuclease family protein [Arthrobacter sp. AK04]MCD5340612.1 GIY-YIG nuclease family protein [Arthrobacter sp. AK04]
MTPAGHTRRASSIRIFMADGDPNGLRLVEKSGWTGIVLVCSRADIVHILKRDELLSPGIYLLVGPPNDDSTVDMYIGESDDVRGRIKQHVGKNLDFWQQVIVATSKDDNLNKAHFRWLEAELIKMAKMAAKTNVSNGNAGSAVKLSEPDTADAASYLDELLLLLPVLGVSSFEVPDDTVATSETQYFIRGRDADARGHESGAGFVVSSGHARAALVTSTPPWAVKLRARLVERGVLAVERNGRMAFTRPYTFDSPSAAAAVVLGRSANGLVEWKTELGETLKVMRDRQVSAL